MRLAPRTSTSPSRAACLIVRTCEREYITPSTTQPRGGSLLYIIGVALQSEAKTYENAFRRVRQSLQIAD